MLVCCNMKNNKPNTIKMAPPCTCNKLTISTRHASLSQGKPTRTTPSSAPKAPDGQIFKVGWCLRAPMQQRFNSNDHNARAGRHQLPIHRQRLRCRPACGPMRHVLPRFWQQLRPLHRHAQALHSLRCVSLPILCIHTSIQRWPRHWVSQTLSRRRLIFTCGMPLLPSLGVVDTSTTPGSCSCACSRSKC